MRTYAITMTVRIVCFLLMALVQPYDWYTWVFAGAAAVLPYFAVVIANAGSDSSGAGAESPERQLEAPAAPAAEEEPHVLIIRETREDDES